MRLAYIMVTFPCLRETFVLREVRHFYQRLGPVNFLLYGYQKPTDADLNEDNREWVSKASYFKDAVPANFIAMLWFLVSRPVRFWRVMRLWISEIPALDFRTNLQVAKHVFTAFGLARKLQRDRVDRAHAHFSTASTLALVAHVLTDVHFSFTAHASGDIYVYSPFLFQKLKRAWRVVAISDYNKRYLELISSYNLTPDKIVTVYNGVELPQLISGSKQNPAPLLFTSAAFTEFKGYGTLLDVLELLQQEGLEFHFVAAGGGPLFDVMQERVLKLGLEEKVTLLGPQPFSEVEKWLAKADIFVFPAEIGLNGQRDGMPTAITEALAHGLPVVATHVTGIPQQVREGINGFLVDERDPKAFADHLKQLLVSAELRDEMGREGRKLAENRFDLDSTLGRLGDVLLEAAGVSPEDTSSG